MKNFYAKEGLVVLSAEIKNFQSLDYKTVECNGKSMVVVGKNGGGKSALMRAIESPLNSRVVPLKAIKEGEEKASVRVKLAGILEDKEVEYDFDLYFDSENGKGRFVVTDKDGAKIVSRSVQESIIGSIGFDIDEFIRLGITSSGKLSQAGIEKQIDALKNFMSEEHRIRLNDIDVEAKEAKDNRKVNKKILGTTQSSLEGHGFTQEELDMYSVSKEDEIIATRKEEDEFMEKIMAWKNHESMLERMEQRVKDTLATIEGLKKSVEHLRPKVSKEKQWLQENTEPSNLEIKERLNKLEKHERNFEKLLVHKKEGYKVINLLRDISDDDYSLESLKKEKTEIFKSSTLPVDGLTFDQNGIYYNDLPFNEDHHPTSTIIGVGVKIAMRMNPNLRCIFIKDGSMFDKETFKNVLAMIEKNGYQLFIEMVDWDAKDDAVVEFAEDFIKS